MQNAVPQTPPRIPCPTIGECLCSLGNFFYHHQPQKLGLAKNPKPNRKKPVKRRIFKKRAITAVSA